MPQKNLTNCFHVSLNYRPGLLMKISPRKVTYLGSLQRPSLCLEKSLVADGTLPPLRKHGCQPLGTAALIIALRPRLSAIWPRLSLCELCAVFCVLLCIPMCYVFCVLLCNVYPCVIYIHPLCAVYRVNVSYVHPCLLELAACV